MFEKVDPEKVLGMSQEDFKKKLDSAVTKDDLTALKTEMAEASKGSLDEIKAALAALKPPPVDPATEIDPTDPTVAVLNDPTGFVRKQMQPLADGQVQTQAQLQEMRARQNPRFAKIFNEFGDELVGMAAKMPVGSRAQDNFWEWHIRTFLGDKFVKGELKQTSYPSLIGSSTVAPGSSDPNDPAAGMDPQVAAWLKDRGVPLDKAARITKLMGQDGEPITLENYKRANA